MTARPRLFDLFLDAAHRRLRLAELLVFTGIGQPATLQEIRTALFESRHKRSRAEDGFCRDQVRCGATLSEAVLAWEKVQDALVEAGKTELRALACQAQQAEKPGRVKNPGSRTELPARGARVYQTRLAGRAGTALYQQS